MRFKARRSAQDTAGRVCNCLVAECVIGHVGHRSMGCCMLLRGASRRGLTGPKVPLAQQTPAPAAAFVNQVPAAAADGERCPRFSAHGIWTDTTGWGPSHVLVPSLCLSSCEPCDKCAHFHTAPLLSRYTLTHTHHLTRLIAAAARHLLYPNPLFGCSVFGIVISRLHAPSCYRPRFVEFPSLRFETAGTILLHNNLAHVSPLRTRLASHGAINHCASFAHSHFPQNQLRLL